MKNNGRAFWKVVVIAGLVGLAGLLMGGASGWVGLFDRLTGYILLGFSIATGIICAVNLMWGTK